MDKRWTTGQEILDRFCLQPFELVAAMAATLTGTTTAGEGVGYVSCIVQYSCVYPIAPRHIRYSKARCSSLFTLMRLREIEKIKRLKGEDRQVYVFDSEDTTFDQTFGLYYALTPAKYKTETGVDIELFYKDIPTFVFSDDEYATIKEIIENEGLSPVEDAPAPVAAVQEAAVVERQEAITTLQDPKQQPGGPTQKELLAEAERLLALKDSDRLEGNDRKHVQAFVYRVKELPLDRVYETLTRGFKDKPSKIKGTRKGNYHAWARKGEKICRDRLS